MANVYFGEPWDAPAVETGLRVETPVGQPCLHCGLDVAQYDRGFLIPTARLGDEGGVDAPLEPIHRACLVDVVLGDTEHRARRCVCFTGIAPAEAAPDAPSVDSYEGTEEGGRAGASH